jgi:hypothetical protein
MPFLWTISARKYFPPTILVEMQRRDHLKEKQKTSVIPGLRTITVFANDDNMMSFYEADPTTV